MPPLTPGKQIANIAKYNMEVSEPPCGRGKLGRVGIFQDLHDAEGCAFSRGIGANPEMTPGLGHVAGIGAQDGLVFRQGKQNIPGAVGKINGAALPPPSNVPCYKYAIV